MFLANMEVIMKAHQAKAETVNTIPAQQCVECHKTIHAPWGRVDGGKWVCSSRCGMAYDTKLHTLPVLDILNRVATPLPPIVG